MGKATGTAPSRDAGHGPDKLLLTPEEAAEALSIGRSKLYELLASGELASVRIGSCRRVPFDALGEFVRRLRQAETGTHGQVG